MNPYEFFALIALLIHASALHVCTDFVFIPVHKDGRAGIPPEDAQTLKGSDLAGKLHESLRNQWSAYIRSLTLEDIFES